MLVEDISMACGLRHVCGLPALPQMEAFQQKLQGRVAALQQELRDNRRRELERVGNSVAHACHLHAHMLATGV